MSTVTKKAQVLGALQSNDRGLTAAQITARFGVGNVRATISDLRMDGFAIYANQSTDSKGRVKTFLPSWHSFTRSSSRWLPCTC